MTDLTMYRGDTKTVQETIGPTGLDSNGIAGWSFWFTAKYDPSESDAAAAIKRVPNDWTVQEAGNATTAGVVVTTLTPATTASLPPYTVVLAYDVQCKDDHGNIFTLDAGTLTILPDVTIATS